MTWKEEADRAQAVIEEQYRVLRREMAQKQQALRDSLARLDALIAEEKEEETR